MEQLTQEQIAVLARTRKKAKTKIRKKIRKKYQAGLLAQYGRICWYCGFDLTNCKITIDHIEPMCDRENVVDKMQRENLALACDLCNLAKANRSLSEFLEWLKHIRSENFTSKFIQRTLFERIEIWLRKLLKKF
jgi:5-methylcytosine-specific restriction endonuclease McrA